MGLARNLYSTWIKNFDNTDEFERSKVRLLIYFTITGSVVSSIYFFLQPYVPFLVPRFVFVLLPLLLNAFCFLLFTRISIKIVSHGLIFSYYLCFMLGTYFSGGINSFVLPWLCLMPVLANLLMDSRSSILWFVISLCSVSMFIFFMHSVPKVNTTAAPWRGTFSSIGLCVSLFLFTSMFDKSRYKILQLLKVRNEELDKQKKKTDILNDKLHEKVIEIAHRNERMENHWNDLLTISKKICVHSDTLENALKYITHMTATSLHVSRVSVWVYYSKDNQEETIQCLANYSLREDRYFSLNPLTAKENVKYFDAIKQEKIIAANDAIIDPDTSGFNNSYLQPNNIKSMLDAPFFLENGLAGVICCEQQDNKREWSHEDIIFVTSMAEIVALAFRSASRTQYEKQLETLNRKVQRQNALLVEHSEEIKTINETLEQRVQQRTKELVFKNEKLSEYAFMNSHLLRGPLCRILGLINLFTRYRDPSYEEELLDRLKISAEELDLIVRKINLTVTTETGAYSS